MSTPTSQDDHISEKEYPSNSLEAVEVSFDLEHDTRSEECRKVTEKDIEGLLELPCNKTCVDCNGDNPTWATINNGGFICTQCAGVHRSLGVHLSFVLSCKLDEWTEKQFEHVESIGNEKLNEILEFCVPSDYPKPNANSSRSAREKYIRAKYEEKCFRIGPNKRRLAPIQCESVENLSSSQAMVEYSGILLIDLIEGKNMVAMDIDGYSDPFVIFKLGGQAVTSRTVKNSLNPVWNEQLLLSWDSKSPLIVEMYDYNIIGPNRPMGSALLSIEDIEQFKEDCGTELWLDMLMRKDWAESLGQHMFVGAEEVGKGLYSGITGVVLDPIRGAKKSGLPGFAKGVGKGLAGIVYRPMKGFSTMVTETAKGVRTKKNQHQRDQEFINSGTIHIKLKLQPIGH